MLFGNAEIVGRLIHDHQLGIPIDGTRNGNRLTLTAREILDRLLEVREMDLERLQRHLRCSQHVGLVEHANEAAEIVFLDLAAQKDVGADIEIVGERQVLIDRLDPLLARIDRAREMTLPPFEIDLAFIRLIDAGDALDQGRLAGAVVAQEADNLAGIDVPTDLVHGHQAAKALGHLSDRQERLGHAIYPVLPRPMIRSRD